MQKFGALQRVGCGSEQRLGVMQDCAARQNGFNHVGRQVNG